MSNSYAKQRIIRDISVEDERIQVTGYIEKRIDDNKIIIEDKTGEISVNLININDFNFKENDLINVIGDLEFHSSGEKVIIADIIQDMKNLNFEYYQKIYQIKKKLDLA